MEKIFRSWLLIYTILTDDNSKTVPDIQGLNVYCNISITNEEFVNHMSKILGTGMIK